MLVLLNFSDKAASFNLGIPLNKSTIVLDNYANTKKIKNNTLRPYEAAIIEFK